MEVKYKSQILIILDGHRLRTSRGHRRLMPEYETPVSLRQELLLKQTIESVWRITMMKLPRRHEIDFLAERDGDAVSFIELKCRTNP